MIDRNARLALIQYLGNKQLSQHLEKGFGQLRDNIKIDDSPLKETTNAVNQQSMVTAFSMALLQSIDQTMNQTLEELKKLNEKLGKGENGITNK